MGPAEGARRTRPSWPLSARADAGSSARWAGWHCCSGCGCSRSPSGRRRSALRATHTSLTAAPALPPAASLSRALWVGGRPTLPLCCPGTRGRDGTRLLRQRRTPTRAPLGHGRPGCGHHREGALSLPGSRGTWSRGRLMVGRAEGRGTGGFAGPGEACTSLSAPRCPAGSRAHAHNRPDLLCWSPTHRTPKGELCFCVH